MKILITGATGFIGSHIARLLVERKDIVRALVRPTSRIDNLANIPCERCIGDLTDAASLREAIKGCEVVYHAAADYRLWSRDPQDLYRSNVEGTRNLLCAAKEANVQRVVYTSSVGTLGIPDDGGDGDEKTPVTLDDMVGHYKRSKYLAEKEAERFCSEYGLPVVIVNPSTPVGEQDIKPTPSGKIILDFLNHKMPAYIDTGLNLVDVRDVARGHLLAEQLGDPGEKYILGSQNISLHDLLSMLADITGQPAPTLRIPHGIVTALATVDTFVMDRLLHMQPHIPLEGVKMAHKRMYFSSEKAKTALGYVPGDIRYALERAVKWFSVQGYVE